MLDQICTKVLNFSQFCKYFLFNVLFKVAGTEIKLSVSSSEVVDECDDVVFGGSFSCLVEFCDLVRVF